MSLRRLGWAAVAVFFLALWTGCGQVYRPVVIPITTTPPTPANFHTIFSVNANVPFNAGTGMQIDVSGDTNVGSTNIGLNPTHAAILPNNSRIFVTSAGGASGGADVVTSFNPAVDAAIATGLNPSVTYSLPSGSIPVFINGSQNTAMYVANFGTNTPASCTTGCTVAAINTSTNVVTSVVPVGANPVALAQLPNGTKVYVANQGDNTVTSLNTVDLSQNILTGFSAITPTWVVARSDSQKAYVLSSGDGKLTTIDTATDVATSPDCSVTPTLCVGPGANFIRYDTRLNRLYITNPANSTLSIFSVTGGVGDTPSLLKTINLGTGVVSANYPSCVNPCPVSVAALPNGSRAYVASYQLSAGCADPTFSASCRVTPLVTVVNTNSNTVTSTLSPLMPSTGPSVPEVAGCIPAIPFAPPATRFRLSTAAAADSSRFYVGMCDAGSVAIINTTTSSIGIGGSNAPDTLISDIVAPFSAASTSNGNEPPPQNPLFLLMGQ